MTIAVLMLSLAAAREPAEECERCNEEVTQLLQDISFYLDEVIPDIDEAERLFEEEDLGPLGVHERIWSPAGGWARILIPSLGIRVTVPPPPYMKQHVHWELFIFWNVRH